MRENCCAHCVACRSCFTSTAAFDAHRAGPADARRCEYPGDVKRLVLKSERGTCKLSDPPAIGSAVVWSTRGWEQAGARFREDAA